VVAFAVAAVVVVLDRVSTAYVVDHLHGPRHLWGPFGLGLTYNSGFAFSLFSGRAWLVTALLCAGVVALAAVVWRVRTVPVAIGAGLVLGGAAGNLSERIAGGPGGMVPDFLTLSFWPTFNLADASVTLGVVIVILALLFGGPEGRHGLGDPEGPHGRRRHAV
jgi:signal peptidase II